MLVYHIFLRSLRLLSIVLQILIMTFLVLSYRFFPKLSPFRAAEKRLAAAVESMRQAQLATERAQNQLYEVSSQAEVLTRHYFAI